MLDEIEETVELVRMWARPEGVRRPSAASGSDISFSVLKNRIHDLETLFSLPNREAEPLEIRTVSIEQLAAHDPERVQFVQTEAGPAIRFRASQKDEWTDVLVPSKPEVMYKGGLPRILLKLYVGGDPAQLRAEIPMNDIDMIVRAHGDDAAELTGDCLRLGADAEGIELVSPETTTHKLMAVRDVDLNECFFGSDGLVFSSRAARAMESGAIHIMDPLERGLYGSESFVFDGIKLTKARGLYRLFKFVAEEKAAAFEQPLLNRQIDFGIYWLVLARKFARKKNAGTLLNRLYDLGRRSGQVREGERDIYDVLRRVRDQYPFFAFTDDKQSETDIARWLAKKLAKMAKRTFRIKRGVPGTLALSRMPGDDRLERISLAGYQDNAELDRKTADGWAAFVADVTAEEEVFRMAA